MIERIGSGAYGEVWLARNTATGARRAVKIVYRATFTDERPFNREFEGIKKFETISHSHPSQMALFQVGKNEAEAYFYYAMELADSVPNSERYRPLTLRADLEQGRLPAARVLDIALSLTEALAQLHANGLIHRDVKPSNIIFVNAHPKLADIGLVTDASDNRSIVGTEGYLAAEGPGTPQADLFALGKVLYEALTGLDRRQFPELPADLRQWSDAKLAFELNTILIKACADHPRDRYSSADSMLADLKLLDAGKSVKRQRSIQRGWVWTWKAAAICGVFFLSFWLVRNSREQSQAPKKRHATPFEQSGTTNRAAWEAFSRGGILGDSFTPAGFSNAVVELEKSLEIDPNFTEARVVLAGYLCLSVEKGYLQGSNALQRARACALTASAQNPREARPWYWLGEAVLGLDYDFVRAERLIRKAIQLDPSDYALRHNFACILHCYGRFDEAESLLKRAIAEDASRAYPHARLGLIYSSLGRLEDGVRELSECILLAPTWPEAHIERAEVLWALDQRAEAARDFLRYIQLSGFTAIPHEDAAKLGATLEQRGPDAFLRTLIDLLKQRRAEGRFVSAYDLARLQALAGDRIGALDDLERAVDEHRIFTLSAKVHIAFKDFQSEPRFQAVLRRLKLEPGEAAAAPVQGERNR